jgi:hypothetical protein
MDHLEALTFAGLLQQAYKGQLAAVPINPYLKDELLEKKLPEGKTLRSYFPFTL